MSKTVLRRLLAGLLVAALLCSGAGGACLSDGEAARPSWFWDVPEGHWAYGIVMRMTRDGLFVGVEDAVDGVGTFAPDAVMDTASMATVLVRALYPEALAAETAAEGEPWYGPVWRVAVTNGLLPRNTDGMGMERLITREETARMLVNALRARGEVLPQVGWFPLIRDAWDIRDECLGDVRTVWLMGMMNGSGDGRFRPGDTLTRAEGAAVLCRLIYPEERASVDSRPPLENLMFLGDSLFANPEREIRVFTRGGNQILAGNGAAAYQFHGLTEREVTVGVEGLGTMTGTLAGRSFNGLVILLGANDLSILDVDRALADYQTLVEELYAHYGRMGIPIFALHTYPVGKRYSILYTEDPDSRNGRLTEFSARLSALCDSLPGVYFLDATAAFTDEQGYLLYDLGDGLHLHQGAFRLFYSEIMAALGASGVFRPAAPAAASTGSQISLPQKAP